MVRRGLKGREVSSTGAPKSTCIHSPGSARFPDARCHFDPNRSAGRGYYDRVCFKIFATERSDGELELVDGGPTDWTRRLLSDRKERLVISGLGVERLCSSV